MVIELKIKAKPKEKDNTGKITIGSKNIVHLKPEVKYIITAINNSNVTPNSTKANNAFDKGNTILGKFIFRINS